MNSQRLTLVLVGRQRWKYLPVAAVAVLAGVLYAPVLVGLVRQWADDPNYSHGFVVPVFSFYLLWLGRHRLSQIPLQPRDAGLVGIMSAIVLLILGSLSAELFVSRSSLIILIVSLVLYFAGWKMLRACAFPLAFLFFMIPLPAIIYYQVTFPLQLQASWFADASLDLLQIPALRDGNIIILPNYSLEVVEACSGIRSLFSLLAVAVAYAHLAERSLPKRIFLVALMVPFAIVSNGFRIVGTGILTYFWGPHFAEGFFHLFAGWIIFLISFALMLLTHRLMSLFHHRPALPPLRETT